MIFYKLLVAIFTIVCAQCSTNKLQPDGKFCKGKILKLSSPGYNYKNQSCYFVGNATRLGKNMCWPNAGQCGTTTRPIFYSKEEFEFIRTVSNFAGVRKFCFEEIDENEDVWKDHSGPFLKDLGIDTKGKQGRCPAIESQNADVTWIDCTTCDTYDVILLKAIRNPNCQWAIDRKQKAECFWHSNYSECFRKMPGKVIVDAVGRSPACPGTPCEKNPYVVQYCPFRDPSFKEKCPDHHALKYNGEAYCRHYHQKQGGHEALTNLRGVYYTSLLYFITGILLAIGGGVFFACRDRKATRKYG